MTPESAIFSEILSDLSLLSDFDRKSPYGFWIGHLDSKSIHLNNTVKVSLDIIDHSPTVFKGLVLGEKQAAFCFDMMRQRPEQKVQLSYACDRGILNYEVTLEQIPSYPGFFVVGHANPPQSPWENDQLHYPYYLKIGKDASYQYYNPTYARRFLGDQQSHTGKNSLHDIVESSIPACVDAADQALKSPGKIISVRLDKYVPGSKEVLNTQWQFVAMIDCYGECDAVCARGYDVSALSRAEKDLAVSRNEYDYFFNSELIGVFFMMLPEPLDWEANDNKEEMVAYAFEHQRVTRCNKTLLAQYGYENEAEFLKRSPKDSFQSNPEEGLRVWREFFSQGHLHTLTREQKADGSPVFIEGDYHLLKDEEGRIVGHFGLQHDVTDRELQKKKYQAGRAQLQKLTESIPGVVFQFKQAEKENELQFLSGTFESFEFGLPRTEIEQAPAQILNLVSPKDYSTLLGSMIYAYRNELELDSEFRMVNQIGEERWFRVKARPEKIGASLIWYGIVQSIDEQKSYERKQEKLAQIARNTSDLMVLVGPNGKVDWLNRACLAFFGWSLEEVLDTNPFELLNIDDPRESSEVILQAIKEQRTFEQKIQVAGKEGPHWLQLRTKPIWNNNGEYLYCLIQMQDIQEEELKNQEMETLLNLTSEQNRRLQSFTYIVSHNIRSHSANLEGLIEAIDEAGDEAEEQELWSYLKQVSSGLESTIKHLNEIIAINRNLNKSKVKLPLKDELSKISSILISEIQNTKAKIVYDFPEDTEVLAVHAYLESILLNLLSNAMRYRHPERNPQVHIGIKEKSGYQMIYVRDNGLGMDLNRHNDRVFKLYQTFHDHPESRGLGLYIVKNQVDVMGGKIKVSSTPGEGTEFRIFLPMEES